MKKHSLQNDNLSNKINLINKKIIIVVNQILQSKTG